MPGNTPSVSTVHVNRPLTNMSTAYLQEAEGFVAARVFPNIPVAKQSDRYFAYPKGAFFRDSMKKRAPGTESAGTTYDIDNTPSYSCDTWALHKDIPDQVRANSDSPLDADRDAVAFLTQMGLLRREKLWASKYFNAAAWTTTEQTGVTAGAAANQFVQWDQSAATIVKDVRRWKRNVHSTTGFNPNKIVLGRAVYDAAMDSPDIIDRIKYSSSPGSPAMAGRDVLARLFELNEVLVMDGIENTAAEGLADSFSYIGGKSALLLYAAPQPGIMQPSAGYCFSWTGYAPGVTGIEGNTVSMLRADLLKADRAEIEMAFDLKVVSTDLAQFASAVVA